MDCVIDCREDSRLTNDLLTLNLWGKPLFTYIIDEVISCMKFNKILVLTNSVYIKYLVKINYKGNVELISYLIKKEPYFMISGRAVMFKAKTISKICELFKLEGATIYSVKKRFNINYYNNISFLENKIVEKNNTFIVYGNDNIIEYELNENESLVINDKNDFELAMVLKRKENNQKLMTESIKNRIEEKSILFNKKSDNSICLLGHSQIDNWNISTLGGYNVINLGIQGISSFEYKQYILDKFLLNANYPIYIMMHGTNDIIYDYSISDIIDSVKNNINYILSSNPCAKIYFLLCIHVNGRLDRSNKYIDELNAYFRRELKNVKLIETTELDNDFGLLNEKYNIDGLHLSKEGYEKLQEIVEKELKCKK